MKEYVVITGANSGIGQALTFSFANAGYNIIAIGRHKAALQHTKLFSVKSRVTIAVSDLSKKTEFEKIVKNFKK